jgi:hypothetical protein
MTVKSVTINFLIGGIQNPDNSLGNTQQYPNNLTYVYSMANSQPPTTAQVVKPNGDIDLNLLPDGPGYSPEADLFFTLSGQIRGTDGNMYSPRWAQPGEGSGFCWLFDGPVNSAIIPWPPGMQTRLVPPGNVPGHSQTVLIDDNRRGDPYYYGLGLAFDNLPGWTTPYFVGFDPSIVNKPNK